MIDVRLATVDDVPEVIRLRSVMFLDKRNVDVVELHATAQGEPLYRSLGFAPYQRQTALRRLRPALALVDESGVGHMEGGEG